MENNTHALPCRNERGYANNEPDQGKHPPGTTSAAQRQDNCDDKTSDNATNAQSASEDNTGSIAVADGPTDEVGVGLAAQRPFDCGDHILEGRGVSGVLQSMKQSAALL